MTLEDLFKQYMELDSTKTNLAFIPYLFGVLDARFRQQDSISKEEMLKIIKRGIDMMK